MTLPTEAQAVIVQTRERPAEQSPPAVGSDTMVLARSLLASQFLPDAPLVPPERVTFSAPPREALPDFRFPDRPDLNTVLNTYTPDLPFDYEPGFVTFAYEPGLHGEVQRFWDAITPEWGFITKSGLHVKCRFVVVAIGCGWN